MRFKVDENLPVETAHLLRQAGYDAVSVYQEGLGGAPDEDVASVCQQEGRVLLTLDLGFAHIRAYPPPDFPGLVVLHLQRQDKAHVLEVLQRLVPLLAREPLEGLLWVVEETRVRIRGQEFRQTNLGD
jgi:predicted nuclease of predicted toxin-antitoxin system